MHAWAGCIFLRRGLLQQLVTRLASLVSTLSFGNTVVFVNKLGLLRSQGLICSAYWMLLFKESIGQLSLGETCKGKYLLPLQVHWESVFATLLLAVGDCGQLQALPTQHCGSAPPALSSQSLSLGRGSPSGATALLPGSRSKRAGGACRASKASAQCSRLTSLPIY